MTIATSSERRHRVFDFERWTHPIIAAVTLVAMIVITLGMQIPGGVFCHMANRAMSSCCCEDTPAGAAQDRGLQGPVSELPASELPVSELPVSELPVSHTTKR